MKLRWSPEALQDLLDIHDFISRKAPAQADQLIDALITSAEQLERFPHSGRSVPEYDVPAIREIIHSPYRIIYRVENTSVEIVTVLHGARKLTSD